MREIPNPNQRVIRRNADGPRMKLPAHFITLGRQQILVAPAETVRIDRMMVGTGGDFHPTLTIVTHQYASGLAAVLNAEECRILGEQLLKEAEILEAVAADAATAAIEKARGGK